MNGENQVCATPNCARVGAFKTRKQPTYCGDCIDAMYLDGGLVPFEAFTARRTRRLTACVECHVELTYPLDYVMEKNTCDERVCRVCFWRGWGASNRKNHKTELDAVLGIALSQPSGLSDYLRELIAGSRPARDSIERWWWPTERTRATVALLHHDLVLDTAEHNGGMDPVVVRCQLLRLLER